MRRARAADAGGLCCGRLAGSAIAVLLVAGSAWAHGGGNAGVRAELDALPEALSGMRVELHTTMGAQIVIGNPTPRTVEVLDEAGEPFLRIGPRGVEGNIAAAAWYLTYSPGAVVPAASRRSGEPLWVRASAESAFGWFEPRVDAAHVAVPAGTDTADGAIDVGHWAVPLRVDGVPVELTGSFRFAPPSAPTYTSLLTSPAEVAPGVRVRMLPGPVPGLLVENAGARPLLVFGSAGEPFLRIGPGGVDANLRSGSWRQSARITVGGPTDADSAVPEWRHVAQVPRFAWIEPRVAAPDASTAPSSQWQVPMQLGDEPVQVTGTIVRRGVESGPLP